jgi:hypothetical protein
MSSFGFALFCLLGFTVPVPILAWLDRARRSKSWMSAGQFALAPRDEGEGAARVSRSRSVP